ncbi:hypothetical protein Y888_15635 [Mixta calida B021323]|nr:hypothetical protein Y888_15635 [Mixta calida B021323]
MFDVSIVAKTGEVYRKTRFFAPVSPLWPLLGAFKNASKIKLLIDNVIFKQLKR